jgi:hypothetical protein
VLATDRRKHGQADQTALRKSFQINGLRKESCFINDLREGGWGGKWKKVAKSPMPSASDVFHRVEKSGKAVNQPLAHSTRG